jgi:hypothetical protein
MRKQQLITLSKTHFLYVALVFLVALPVIVFIVVSPGFGGVWCRQFDMPDYEARFGFKLGSFEVSNPHGDTYSVTGIARVDPSGAFGRAGVRTGDVPRMYHGLGDFCSDLAVASRGDVVDLELVNVMDLRAGKSDRRRVALRLRAQ